MDETDETDANTPSSGRGRSTIGFPYADLPNAEQLADTVYAHGGECAPEQLAAWLKPPMSAESGGFRSRVTAAQMFGLLERPRGRGQLSVTDLGQRILDPAHATAARVEAFLNVPLFAAMFKEHNRRRLPPAAALEQHITRLGVAPKQASRARQTLLRSAERAGFMDAHDDRLVMPAGAHGEAASVPDSVEEQVRRDTPPPDLDPMLRGLFERLPREGRWSQQERQHWLDAAKSIFVLVYGPVEDDRPMATPAADTE